VAGADGDRQGVDPGLPDDENLEVVEAKDGEEGLRMAPSEKPDMILLDMLMPKMNGLHVMEKVRADAWGKSVPIVVLTNRVPDDKNYERVTK